MICLGCLVVSCFLENERRQGQNLVLPSSLACTMDALGRVVIRGGECKRPKTRASIKCAMLDGVLRLFFAQPSSSLLSSSLLLPQQAHLFLKNKATKQQVHPEFCQITELVFIAVLVVFHPRSVAFPFAAKDKRKARHVRPPRRQTMKVLCYLLVFQWTRKASEIKKK